MHHRKHPPRHRRTLAPLGAALTACLAGLGNAEAMDIEADEWKGTWNTTVTLGTQVRAQAPNQSLMFAANGATQGMGGNRLTGQNDDDANLNFRKGDQVSTVLKALSEIRLKRQDTEVVLKAKAWTDFALENDGRTWGNVGSRYQAGAPLSDKNFGELSKFTNIALMDAYVAQRLTLGEQTVDLRAGNYVLQQWGERSSIGGGLAAINPVDVVAARRPGALAGESTIPVPQVGGRWQFSPTQSVEAFYQLAYRHSELPACGTFLAGSDYVAAGCDKIFPSGLLSDRAKLAANNYVKRASTLTPDDSGQFGLAYRFRVEAIDSNFGLHFAQYHNRTPNITVIKSPRATPYIPGDADGQNVRYQTEYADKVRVWGLSFDTKAAGTNFFGEFTYRPNQPLGLNGTDLLNAFLSNTAPSMLRQDAIATAAGGTFHGYDRYKQLQLQAGASRAFKDVLGADSLTLAGEVGIRRLPSLPDPGVRRYGRSTVYGLGPVSGSCLAGSTAVMCSEDGYATATSWGYRLRASARYPGLLAGADLTPSVSFAHDVKGWSQDGVFNEGRKIASLSLRADYQKRYFADLTYVTAWGGTYDNLTDRDYVALSVGYSF